MTPNHVSVRVQILDCQDFSPSVSIRTFSETKGGCHLLTRAIAVTSVPHQEFRASFEHCRIEESLMLPLLIQLQHGLFPDLPIHSIDTLRISETPRFLSHIRKPHVVPITLSDHTEENHNRSLPDSRRTDPSGFRRRECVRIECVLSGNFSTGEFVCRLKWTPSLLTARPSAKTRSATSARDPEYHILYSPDSWATQGAKT